MKKIITVIAIVILSSCARITHIPATENFYGLDFRKYTEKGFLFTPGEYPDAYESIGVVSIVAYPEYNYFPATRDKDGARITASLWASTSITTTEVMDSISEKVLAMGGDALMNFKLESVSRTEHTGGGSYVTVEGKSISGFAIKRK